MKQWKFEARALKFRFLGYPDAVKGYRLWCIDFKPLWHILTMPYIKQDITVNEEEMLYKTRSSKTNENKRESIHANI